jgi:hypothetical protein
MRCTISQIYFDKELYMFRTDLLSIVRSLNTVYTGLGICYASYVDCLLARSGWIAVYTVLRLLMMGSRSVRNIWSSLSKKNLEIVHLVGFYCKNSVVVFNYE